MKTTARQLDPCIAALGVRAGQLSDEVVEQMQLAWPGREEVEKSGGPSGRAVCRGSDDHPEPSSVECRRHPLRGQYLERAKQRPEAKGVKEQRSGRATLNDEMKRDE